MFAFVKKYQLRWVSKAVPLPASAAGLNFSVKKTQNPNLGGDPLGVLEALLWRSNSVLAISQHGARSNVYEEATTVVKKHKASPEEVEVQLTQYRQGGLPEDEI
ncbi:hypothetical protein GH714_014776 [Hevea brasiliensis]|uniref:TOD1/MUCI70 glycosyltransferase-like domain-containing protein n=1 Tax=Hevea brasiliensis TaxID=3981 RepID=A0A6A6NH59_HEVBR|nr:hypothetical protein GH714_014776 [Hevea brasiliensis]